MKRLGDFFTAISLLFLLHWIRYLFIVGPLTVLGRLFGGAQVISWSTLGMILGPAGWLIAFLFLIFSSELGIANAWKETGVNKKDESPRII
ncbi:hypothetical protein [Klebsiella quasipneumoniae]|uniref:hypothetical protein n=1 Tax=Klebsiella quasipneumoniae TaxID=1463165 RepID=UPI001C844630|nr:hypothetical protein [Klebsiella quasipneumoniae]